MKQSFRILISLLFVITAVVDSSQAQAQDVYNFYFQKDKAPHTVIQGGGQQKVRSPEATNPNTEKASPPAASTVAKAGKLEEVKKSLKNWRLYIGSNHSYSDTSSPYSSVVDSSLPDQYAREDSFNSELGSGKVIGGEYTFNRYVGLEGTLYFSKNNTYINTGIGAVLTPFRFNVFGHDLLDIFFVAGGKSLTYWDVDSQSSGSAYTFYSGVGYGINFTDEFSLRFWGITSTFAADNREYDVFEGTAALAWNF